MKAWIVGAALAALAGGCGKFPSEGETRARLEAICKDWRDGHAEVPSALRTNEARAAWAKALSNRTEVSGACLGVERLSAVVQHMGPGGRSMDVAGLYRHEVGLAPFAAELEPCDGRWCVRQMRVSEPDRPADASELVGVSFVFAQKVAKGDGDAVWNDLAPAFRATIPKDAVVSYVHDAGAKCQKAVVGDARVSPLDTAKNAPPTFQAVQPLTCGDVHVEMVLRWQWVLNGWVLIGFEGGGTP